MISLRECVRRVILDIRQGYFTRLYGMNIHPSARIGVGARLDKTNPKGIHIGEESFVASSATILAHDFSRGIHRDTVIGKRCFIGVNVVVMCGVTIGDEVIVGAGAIVTKDVPSRCVVAGNPARIIRQGIRTRKYGQLKPD